MANFCRHDSRAICGVWGLIPISQLWVQARLHHGRRPRHKRHSTSASFDSERNGGEITAFFIRGDAQFMSIVTIEMLGDRQRRIRRLQTIAQMMDTAFVTPGTNIRFGADARLGLIPGVGDVVGAAISLAIVNEARRLDVSNAVIAKMLVNIGVDAVVGGVLLLEDVFDVYFKANRRNVQLLLEHFQNGGH